MENMETRVSVLETKVQANTVKIDETQNMITKFFDKLDRHIEEETQHDIELQKGMIKVTDVVEHLTAELSHTNTTLKEFSEMTKGNNIQLVKLDSAWTTVLKICGVIVMVISGVWLVWSFTMNHPELFHTHVEIINK